jgi:thermostable 8-oxoguanine DNA glycosylase
VRYKPLLTYITKREDYDEIIAEMRENLVEVLPKICTYFDNPKFARIIEELDKYDRKVKEHLEAFNNNGVACEKVSKYLNDIK